VTRLLPFTSFACAASACRSTAATSEARRFTASAADRRDRPQGIFPHLGDRSELIKAHAQALAAYTRMWRRSCLRTTAFTYQGSNLIDPKGGNPVAFDIHLISRLVGLVALAADHHEEPAGGVGSREHQARAPTTTPGRPRRSARRHATLLWRTPRSARRTASSSANLSAERIIASGETAARPATGSNFATPARPASSTF